MRSTTPTIPKLMEQERERFVEILQGLSRAAADGHGGVQDFVARSLESSGADVHHRRYAPADVTVAYELGRPSDIEGDIEYVVGVLGAGDGGLLFFAHSDSEPVDPTGWTRPLFAGQTDGGRLYGWGVGDDLVGVALLLALAHAHARGLPTGAGRVMLASTPSKRRAQGIIHAMDHGFAGDASVYLHPAESGAGLREIKAIASGTLRFTMRIPGRPPDTSEPGHTVFLHQGVDPVRKAAYVMDAIERLASERAGRVRFGPIHDAVGRSTNLHVSYLRAGDAGRLGKVPPHVDLGGSLTFPPNEALEDVKAEVEAALEEAFRNDPWLAEHPPEVAWEMGIAAAATDPSDSIYRTTHEAIRTVTGEAPHVNPLHAASDIRNPILHKGSPTVGIGPLVGDLTVSGGVDEWVDVADYLRAVEVVCRIASQWTGG